MRSAVPRSEPNKDVRRQQLVSSLRIMQKQQSALEATVQQTWPSCYTQHPKVRVSGRQAGGSSESSSQYVQERKREGQWR